MFFLRRGNVNVLAPRSTRVVATLEEGGYFGEIGILVRNGRRSNTVIAATKCEYYTLGKDDLDWVLDRFPEYRELLRNAALKRLEQMAKILDASLSDEQGLDLIEGRILVEIQEMRGVPLTHQGFEKFCRVACLNHIQNSAHPTQEHEILHDEKGHIKHKYDFNAILNFHFEVEQRSYDTVKVRFLLVFLKKISLPFLFTFLFIFSILFTISFIDYC
jgi:CRP-like cAMP-binding protein